MKTADGKGSSIGVIAQSDRYHPQAASAKVNSIRWPRPFLRACVWWAWRGGCLAGQTAAVDACFQGSFPVHVLSRYWFYLSGPTRLLLSVVGGGGLYPSFSNHSLSGPKHTPSPRHVLGLHCRQYLPIPLPRGCYRQIAHYQSGFAPPPTTRGMTPSSLHWNRQGIRHLMQPPLIVSPQLLITLIS